MVYKVSEQTRSEQRYSTIAWELFYNNAYIDKIISSKSQLISFDHSGNLRSVDGNVNNLDFNSSKENNIFYSDLNS